MTIRRLEVNGDRARWVRNGAELVVDAEAQDPHGQRDPGSRHVLRCAEGVPAPARGVQPAHRVHGHRRRRDGGRAARRRRRLVPGQRPPAGQGVLRLPRHGAATGSASWPTASSPASAPAATATRFDWHAPEPMASYLATIDIGKWDVRQGRTASGIPVYDAVDPDLLADPVYGPSISASLARQGEVARRAVVVLRARTRSARSAPSSTTRTTCSSPWRRRPGRCTRSTSGPTAVTACSRTSSPTSGTATTWRCEQWQDIWLNEGWATYAEWIWAEHEGQFTPQDAFDFIYDDIPADDPFWQFVVGAAAAGRPVRRPGLHPGRV